jgi:CHAT domain-containing protein
LVASPEDLPTFDLEREWEILGQALAGLTSGGSVAVERLDDCSEANLQRVLTQQTFQVLHFVGYGRSNLRARYGSLVLIDEHRNSRAMPAEYLGKLLGQTTVRLAVLDFGRRVDEFNPFAEAARGLVRNGINSVIAMRRRLSSTAATTFYQGLYSALASGSAVDQSVESARRAMTQSPGEVEWDIPMLYTAMGNQAALSIENAAQDSGRVRDLAGSARVGTANTQISVERPAIEHSTQNLSSGPNHRRVKISAAPLDQTREHPHKIKKILVLAASPENLTQLRLGEEMREIASGLLRAKYRQRFQLENRLAVRPLDLQQAMVEVQPQIVHFCGHGAGLDGLVFEDNNGLSKPIPSAALANLFKLFSDKIECVVLNSCHSDPQAKAISEHIPYVIGMKAQVGDRAAIDFAIGFYRALGAGYAIDFAFRLGCSAIELENLPDYLTPVMRERSDISGNEAVM